MTDRDRVDPGADRDGDGSAGGRSVILPLRLYKTVTVFSTLLAIVGVVLGFVFLDRATEHSRTSLSGIDPALAVLGLAFIVLAGAIYAFSTRFRAGAMGKPKERTDERSDNG